MKALPKHNCSKPIFGFEYEGNRKHLCDNLKDKEQQQRFREAMRKYKQDLWSYFLCRIQREISEETISALKKAYNMAYEAHYCQFRKVGRLTPYISHPIEVALILLNEMNLDKTAAISGILHDVLEDSDLFTYDDIKREFDETVAITVDGVTKMTKLGGTSRDPKLETFRKMILSISEEYRVILVKIADRLHNMRTMDGMPAEKQKIKAAENLVVYAKFANAIGMIDIKRELEDLSFKYIHPKIYKKLQQYIQSTEKARNEYLNSLKLKIFQILTTEGYNIDVKYDTLSMYEVWQKILSNKNLNEENGDKFNLFDFLKIYDYKTIRIVILEDNDNINLIAFQIIGVLAEKNLKTEFIHNTLTSENNIKKPIGNQIKALTLKINFDEKPYSRLLGSSVRVQIMSKEQDIISRKGANFERIKDLIQRQEEGESITHFIDRILDLLKTDFIYIQTTENKIYQLPKGSTVLDLAFHISIDLGLRCLGAETERGTKGRFEKLSSGEILRKIITSKQIYVESDWLKYVQTSKAKNAIRNYLKTHGKAQMPSKNVIQTENLSEDLPIIIRDYTQYELASCCNPTPESKAVALRDDNGNYIIHKYNCQKLTAIANKENLRLVEWRIPESYYKIHLTALDRIGLLKDLTDILSGKLKVNMKEVHMYIEDKKKQVIGDIIFRIRHNISNSTKNDSETETCEENICTEKDLNDLASQIQEIDGIINVTLQLVSTTSSKMPE